MKEPLALGSIMDVKVDSLGNVWALFENNHLIRLLGDKGICNLYQQYFDSKYAALSLFVDSSGTFSFNCNQHRYCYDSKKDSFAEEYACYPWIWNRVGRGITVEFWAFPIHCSVALPNQPCIWFLFVSTSCLLMASFRFRVAPDTLANR